MINYKKPSVQLAVDMVNECCNGSFTYDEIEFTEVKYRDTGYYNTSAVLVPTEGSPYQDSIEINYDRINIASFFRGVTVKVPSVHQKRISEYLPYVNAQFDLGLTVSDIVDGVIPNGVTPPFRLAVEMQSFNPAYYGSFEILVSDDSNSLARILKNKDLRGISYPTENRDLINGPYYFYGGDWSSFKSTFGLYSTAGKIDEQFVNRLNQYDNNTWCYSEDKQPFNLYNAKVTYHGDNFDDNPYTKKKHMDKIFIITPDEEYSDNISGYLVFHYNDYYQE